MCAVEGGKGDDKERSGVFPGVDQVREGPFGVAVTSQTLDETEPGGKTLDDRADAVGVGVTHVFTCGREGRPMVVTATISYTSGCFKVAFYPTKILTLTGEESVIAFPV